MLLLGAVMAIAGRRREAVVESGKDCRACPICAETIKIAALKCKHCGSDTSSTAKAVEETQPASDADDSVGTQIWIARGAILAVFVGIILFSLMRH